MNADQLLLALRDIHPPPEPAWWHLSPAWLSLIGLTLATVTVVFFVYRRRKMNRMVHRARRDLMQIVMIHERTGDNRELALALAHWLKRVALAAFPDRQLEPVSGQRWLDFLDQSAGHAGFSSGGGRLFGGAVYREQVICDAAEIIEVCEQWLKAVTPRLQQQGRVKC